MSKRGVIQCLLSVVLLVYLAAALAYAHNEVSNEHYKALEINIARNESTGFVTATDIDVELGTLSARIKKLAPDSVNTLQIERTLAGMDNIETANCIVLNNGNIRVDVVPLVPLARVFDITTGKNFYINKDGKRMRANSRYRVDVPVVTGRFSEKVDPIITLPVLRHIAADSRLTPLTSALKVEKNGDIFLIPRVRGHVVNLGDTTDLADKTERLLTFYHKVLPVKGWEHYDTISVKWRGQVVAKRRSTKSSEAQIAYDEDYIDDPSTMMATHSDAPTP